MSYLLDKKIRQKKILKISLAVLALLVLFYFRSNIINGLSYAGAVIFRPVWVLGNNVGEKLNNFGSYFASKNSLYLENENLKSQIRESEADRANYDSVVADNASLKEILRRKETKATMILSAVLAKPNQSSYDTLIIDAGLNEGIKKGEIVFALGNVPIGIVAETYPNSSKIILFSNSREKTGAIVGSKHTSVELVGRGGGNFEMIVPRDLVLTKGDQALLPGINSYVVGIVETVISDPRDPFTKALLTSPVNIQELKFVEIKTN